MNQRPVSMRVCALKLVVFTTRGPAWLLAIVSCHKQIQCIGRVRGIRKEQLYAAQ